jgi:hypothetical protein
VLRIVRSVVVAVAVAAAGSAAGAQSQPRAIQAGTYDLSITYGGGLLDATLTIGYRGDTVTAKLKLGDHDSPVHAGTPNGTTLALEPDSPQMDVRYRLEFTGDRVKGTFTYQGESGTVTGALRRKP